RRALLGDSLRGSGASDPDRDVRVLDAVLCRFGGCSIVAGGVRGGDGRVGLGDRPVVPGRENADRDVRVRNAVLRRDGDGALVDRALSGLGGRDRGGGGRAGGVRLLYRPVGAGAAGANGQGGFLRVGLCRGRNCGRRLVARDGGGRLGGRCRLGAGRRLVLLRDRRGGSPPFGPHPWTGGG